MHKTNQPLSLICVIVLVVLSLMPGKVSAQFVEKGIFDPGLQTAIHAKSLPEIQADVLTLQSADSTLDVQGYEVWMDWYSLLAGSDMSDSGRQCNAHVTIVVRPSKNVASLDFDAEMMAIDSATVNGSAVVFDVQAGKLKLVVPGGVISGNVYRVDVWYSPLQRRKGFYAYTGNEIDSNGTVATSLVYTFAEPNDARYWFPCNDQPHDKALFTFHGRVPSAYTVVSNGLLVDSTADGDSASWQSWHCSTPMPSYLFVANASKYSCLKQEVTSIDGRTIPIRNYYWPQDHEGTEYNAVNTFARLPQMITAFEHLFGRFPFESYGHTAVAPITIGGMEHQTMTTIARRWLKGDLEFAIAHELGHQWTGDQITCGTWADIWMNEGGAAWSEALWNRELNGEAAYRMQMNGRRNTYMKSAASEPPVYMPQMVFLFNEATTYCKAGWIYHMMYTMCGQQFLDALKLWFAKGPTSLQTKEFRDFLKVQIPNPEVPWDVFFDQWLLQPYHPVVGALVTSSDRSANAGYTTTVSLTQLQLLRGFNTVFQFPLQFTLSDGSSSFDTTMIIKDIAQSVTVNLPFAPTTCVLNPNDRILMQDTVVVLAPTSVDEHDDRVELEMLSPEPVRQGSDVYLRVTTGAMLTAYSVTGTTIFSTIALSEQVVLPTDAWPTGMILLVAEGPKGIRTLPLMFIH